MGNRNSMPASSASCARRMLLSQELTQRSGTFVTDIPPEQFGEKKPNFNLLWFRMGDCFRPMKPQSDPVAGFYSMDNLRIMPENSNCSSRADTSRNRRVLHISWGARPGATARALDGLTFGQPKTFFDALPLDLADAIACMTPLSVGPGFFWLRKQQTPLICDCSDL